MFSNRFILRKHRKIHAQTFDRMSPKTARKRTFKVIESLLLELERPVCEVKKVIGALRADDYPMLTSLAAAISTQLYGDPDTHRVAAQVVATFKKLPFFPERRNEELQENAWRSFLKSERRMRRINALVKKRQVVGDHEHAAIHHMREYIRKVIGETPNIQRIAQHCDFGPGSSIGVTGESLSFPRKLENLTATGGAIDIVSYCLRSNQHYLECLATTPGAYTLPEDIGPLTDNIRQRISVVDGNKITFVPKEFSKLRQIAIEPSGNGYVQKGADLELRAFLLRAGIDLTLQSRNRRLAKDGSRNLGDPYCTIDLSDSSNTICVELVRLLLPFDWFYFLNRIRSDSYAGPNGLVQFQMFSSQGNGVTFPLQTLLYAAICATAYHEIGVKPDFSVYGDDIIIRKSVFKRVSTLLRHCGMVVNQKKSFSEGYFRESCGGDYINGTNVRPVYFSNLLLRLEDYISLHNNLQLTYTSDRIPKTLELLRSLSGMPFLIRPCVDEGSGAFNVPESRGCYERNVSLQCPVWIELQTVPIRDSLLGYPLDTDVIKYVALLKGSHSGRPFVMRRRVRYSFKAVAHGTSGNASVPS